ncbi:hypothetical protein ACHAQA_002089 [Verticillium albo-atrum]
MLACRLGLLGLLTLLASSVSASYVQYQMCDQAQTQVHPRKFPISSVTTRIDAAEDGHQWLSWAITLLMPDEEECRRQARNISAEFSVEMLTGTIIYETNPVLSCQKVRVSRFEKGFALRALLTEDVGLFHPMSTFHSDIRLASAATGDPLTCVQANITPQLGPAVSSTLRWAPFGLFLFVLLVSILRSCFDKPISLAGDADEIDLAPPARSVLPHVGDCLQYLQFVFLTGSLSLWYPGFYQPAVSNLNWFSLFLTGPITHGHVYPSIVDGIYEINGTYGGTFGLELMHQIVGAPATMATWMNMVISLCILVVLTALLLECLRLGTPRPAETHMMEEQAVVDNGFQYRVNRVLRIILSYFTLPLIALSFYQTNNAGILPKYHTALAVLLIVTIVAAFAWLLRQIPTRSLGLLVFDAKRYQRLSASTSSNQHGEAFILVLFVLAFIRGAAVGGLQISPPAQLAVLGACEMVLLACIYGFQAYPALSIGTISAVVRLVTLTLMVAFLPKLANIHIKSAIGYVVLLLHGSMLVCGFLGPAMYHLVVLCVRQLRAPKPDVYGLRELRRREASRTDLNRAYIDLPSPISPSSDYKNSRIPGSVHSYTRPGSVNSLHPETPHIPASRYFRPPRPSSVRSKGSVDLQSKVGSTSKTSSSFESRGPSRAVSPLVNTAANFGAILELNQEYDAVSPLRTSESSSSAPSSSDDSPTSSRDSQGRPLGPRWNDYSFRESDLYYMVPRPGAPGVITAEEAPEPVAVRPTIRSVSSSLWTKVTGQDAAPAAQEMGFKVIRPNNGIQGLQGAQSQGAQGQGAQGQGAQGPAK